MKEDKEEKISQPEKQKRKEEKQRLKQEKKAKKEASKKEKKSKKENQVMTTIKNKWLKDTTLTVLMIISVLSAYLAVNMVTQALDITDLDLTKQKLYSISEETKKQLDNVEKQVNMYMFGYQEDTSVVDIAKQYAKYKENIKMEVVSIESRPDLVEKYDITSQDESYQTILFESEGRTIKSNYYDFYTYDYNTGEYIDLTEQRITNSILAVTLDNAPKVYFLTGHGEYTTAQEMTALATELKSEVNEIDTLDLLVTQSIPEDCQAIIISTPKTDFTDFETDLIIKYINNGGDILWMSDYLETGKLTNTQKILDVYGVTLSNDGMILEQDRNLMLMQSASFILPKISTEAEITSPFATSGKVFFLNSGKIDVKNSEELETLDVTVTPLLYTSEKAFYRTDVTIETAKKTEGEEENEYIVGALATKTIQGEGNTKTSNLVIYANNLFAADYPIQVSNQESAFAIYFYNNRDLILNSISYLTERTDTITIRKTIDSITYSPTELEDIIVKAIIFIVPLIIIAIGIIVWTVRRHRRNKKTK